MNDLTNTNTNTKTNNTGTTTVVVAKPAKSAIAAFFLTLLFGPVGLLYASIVGGIVMTIGALILIPLTFGIGFLIIWPVSMIWAVVSALISKKGARNVA